MMATMRAALVFLCALVAGCRDDDPLDCHDGTCVCPANHACDAPCGAPPCHLDCQPGSDCSGECGNGTCTCRAEATCNFDCQSPPCHVTCEGDHPYCDGVCANGTCSCGPNSSCAFTCSAPPCHAECGEGSACGLLCPDGYGNGCDFTACAAGEPMICPDGIAVCNAGCAPS